MNNWESTVFSELPHDIIETVNVSDAAAQANTFKLLLILSLSPQFLKHLNFLTSLTLHYIGKKINSYQLSHILSVLTFVFLVI